MSDAIHRSAAGISYVPITLRSLRSALALLVVVFGAACSEKLDGGGACPSLCPEPNLEIETVELTPVVLDTALARLTPLGNEPLLLLTTRGDTAETYAVIRFDTLPPRAGRERDTTTIAITKLDSAYLRMRLDTTSIIATAPITIDVYDVDTTDVADTATAPIAALFHAGRRIGGITLQPADLRDPELNRYRDSLRIPIDTAFLRQRIVENGRARVGLAIRSTASAQLRIVSNENSIFPTINYLATSPDTSKIETVRASPTSETPNADRSLNGQFIDYTIIVTPTSSGSPQDIIVGGLPGRRTYLRFELPAEIVDSATVTRAELILTQRPNPGSPSPGDTLQVRAAVVLAGVAVTDVARAALITEGDGLFPGTIDVPPEAGGTRTLDVTIVLRAWRGLDAEDTPRALVLSMPFEGVTAGEVRFFSSEAADPATRPRLRISYIPRVGFGLP
jgi:hypothetical protein